MWERGWIFLVLAALLVGCGGDDTKPKRTERQRHCEQLAEVAQKALEGQGASDREFESVLACLSVPTADADPASAAEAERLVRSLPGACVGSTITAAHCEPRGAGWDCDFRDSKGGTGSATLGEGVHPEVRQLC